MKRALFALCLSPIILTTQLLQAQVPHETQPEAQTERDHDANSRTESEPTTASDSASTEATETQESAPASPEENRALYERAEQAYDQGEYDQALELFELLYERTSHPALLFNMAQAHRMAGPSHCVEAHRLYLQYLVDDPSPPNGREVRERVKELEPCAQEAMNRQDASTTPGETSEQAPSASPAAKAVTITGGAVMLVGLSLFTASKIRFAQAKDECPCDSGTFSTWQGIEKAGVGAMIAGGSGLAIGGVWWWVSADTRPDHETLWLGASGTF